MPRDWNLAYLTGDTPWDKGMAAPPLREFLSEQSIEGRVLVPGCGVGHDVRLLAAEGADVVGMDVASAAVEAARSVARAADESYVCDDFLDLNASFQGEFDWVVEHTCLCAIEPEARGRYLESVVRALRPGGHFLAIFYRNIPGFDGAGPPYPISSEEIERLFGGSFERLHSTVPQMVYPSRPAGSEELCWMRLK